MWWKKNRIEILDVSDVIERYIQEAPVNLPAIANELGITIREANLSSQIAGEIRKDPVNGGKSGYVILVNQSDNPNRQRFTIAHELGHFIFHKDFIGDGITEDSLYRSGLSNEMERQANKFAAYVLMPKDLVIKLMHECGNDTNSVAKKLMVSKAALKIFIEENQIKSTSRLI